MADLDRDNAVEALRATGGLLASRGYEETVRLVVAGSTAGLIAGWLRASRVTADCDVIWRGEEGVWEEVEAAAGEVARRYQLPEGWLNRDATIFGWSLPLGWPERCEAVGRFGPLEVARLSRFDLIAAKVVSAPRRPHDVEDLLDLRPTAEEIGLVEEHLDRLEAEDLDRASYDRQRRILSRLRGGA